MAAVLRPSLRPSRLAALAMSWYGQHARDLPWRRPEASPWAVLVSEVMLQQTPVARVLPMYVSWLDRWPTPAVLAAEPAGEAIRAWGRLGYPRRALRLHQCAQFLVDHHRGAVPADLDALLTLPGVGAYTARAVAAFAFGQRHPVVDTNVRRMIARARTGVATGGAATTTRDLAAVEELLPLRSAQAARASAAFMELGALVCTARAPNCAACPLRSVCAWRLAGWPSATVPARPAQRYEGTDRQVRGILLQLARTRPDGFGPTEVEAAWPASEQRDRALGGLITDGLLVQSSPRPDGVTQYRLPGFV